MIKVFYYKDACLANALTRFGISEEKEITLNKHTFEAMWTRVADLPDEIGHPFDHMNDPTTNPLSILVDRTGDGQEMLAELDIHHTSMSVGDCYQETDGKLLMLIGVGVAEVTLV